jgi:hypothetical protein
MADVLIVMIVFSVLLSAIVGGIWLKAQKLKAAAGPDPQLAARLAQLEAQNADLHARVETLETIVTSDVGPSHGTRLRVDAGRAAPADDAVGVPAAQAREAMKTR